MLQFVGYNAEKDCFFVSSCKLDRINTITVELVKEYRGSNDAVPITYQGEYKFLQTLPEVATSRELLEFDFG